MPEMNLQTAPTTRTRKLPAASTYPELRLGLGRATAQICVITPEIAADWLGRPCQVQRSIIRSTVDVIERAIVEKRWEFNGEPIIWNAAGELADGRHRLTACVKSEMSIIALVVRGIPKDAFWTIDTGRSRTGQDALKASGYSHASGLSAAAGMIWKHEHGIDPSHRGLGRPDKEGEQRMAPVRVSPAEVRAVIQAHPELESVAALPNVYQSGKVIRSQGLAIFCYYVMSKIHEDDANEFFAKLGTGEELGKGDPILLLRQKVMGNNRLYIEEKTRLIYLAWNLWREDQTVSRLSVKMSNPLPGLV